MTKTHTLLALLLLCTVGLTKANWVTLDFPDASYTYVKSINGDKIVGYYEDISGTQHGFLYNGVTWATLDFPGASSTRAYGIDGDKIVGCYEYGVHRPHGFLYNGITWDTLDAPGATWTAAHGIDGDKIVGCYDGRGFLYDGSTWTTLEFVSPGLGGTCISDIDGNNMVGYYTTDLIPSGLLYDGMSWTPIYAFGTMPWTLLTGIDGNKIVGYYGPIPYARGFLYDGTSWTALDFPGATCTEAQGIDDDKIVGYYRDANGLHGFIYTIPAPPIEADVDIDPDTLNLNSKGKWITCYIWLPEEYDVADVNSQSVFLKDVIGAAWIWADEQAQIVMAKFKRSDIQEMLAQSGEIGEVEMTVTGKLIDGTLFEGMDTIRVIDKGKK